MARVVSVSAHSARIRSSSERMALTGSSRPASVDGTTCGIAMVFLHCRLAGPTRGCAGPYLLTVHAAGASA
jgi:hypothetical protein